MAQRYAGRQRAYTGFAAQIEDFVKETDARMLALYRASVSDLVENAQTPVAKGGRMRVDTGFLRASLRVSKTGMPSGDERGEKDAKYAYNDDGLVSALASLKMGDVLHIGWTANYAKYRELYDGFLEGALMQWARIVAFNTDTLRKRLEK